MEKLSKEELGRLVASRWTGENAAQKMDVDTTTKEEHNDDNNLDTSNSGNVRGDDDDSYTSGIDADSKYDGDDDEEEDDDDDDDDDISDDEFEDVDTSRSFNSDNDEKAEVSGLFLVLFNRNNLFRSSNYILSVYVLRSLFLMVLRIQI